MEHSRKQKLLMIVAVASLSIGFAAFSVTLNISSSASVTPSSDTFSVKFSSSYSKVDTSPIQATDHMPGILRVGHGIIDNSSNPTIKNFSVTFSELGQYVEFVFYVRNEGEYTAYLNSVNFLGDKVCKAETGTTDSLVQSACEAINAKITIGGTTYTETSDVTGQPLAIGDYKLIRLRLEYASNGNYVDGPFSITFPDIAFVYSTVDDPNVESDLPKKLVRLESGTLSDPGSVVSIGNEKFYVMGQENGIVKLLAMHNLNVGYVINGDSSSYWIPIENPTGIQDEFSDGYTVDGTGKVVYPYKGTVPFSTISRLDRGYDSSLIKPYVENYGNYLMGLGANILNVRLITLDEISAFGCDYIEESCPGAPDWLTSSSYWTETYDISNFVIAVKKGGSATSYFDYYQDMYGVRPVIEIAASEF